MKKQIIISIILVISIFGGGCNRAFAQGKKGTTIQLSFFKKSDLSKTAIAKVSAKDEEGKFFPAPEVPVNFYMLKDKEQILLGKTVSDEYGYARINLPKDLPVDKDGFFNVTVKLENDSSYEDADDNFRFKDANLTIKLDPNDTAKVITASLTETGKDGMAKPVKEVAVKFYVQRLFGDMPAVEENEITTNENGDAIFTFPNNIPGDTLGNITVAAKIEDNEQYGNIESRAPAKKWGVIVPVDKDPFPRALWAPRAPIQLIVTLIVLFGVVWSAYFFVFYQLRRIKKEKIIIENDQARV